MWRSFCVRAGGSFRDSRDAEALPVFLNKISRTIWAQVVCQARKPEQGIDSHEASPEVLGEFDLPGERSAGYDQTQRRMSLARVTPRHNTAATQSLIHAPNVQAPTTRVVTPRVAKLARSIQRKEWKSGQMALSVMSRMQSETTNNRRSIQL